MLLIPTEEQELLAKTARQFVDSKTDTGDLTKLRDEKDAIGFSRNLWGELADLGMLGIQIPEAQGGSGLGLSELGALLEAMGRRLVPGPFISTLLLGSNLLQLGRSEAQAATWLPKVASGQAVLSFAYQEPRSRYNLRRVATRAQQDGDGYRLTGRKIQVLDGHLADLLIVAARTAGGEVDADGITLFAVDPTSDGVRIERQFRVDTHNAALIHFENVSVSASSVLGEVDAGLGLASRAIDIATAGIAAEMLGAASQCFDDTLSYLKERKQFGVFIGTFQALQHRAARMFVDLSLSRVAVTAALRTADETPDRLALMASMAKSRMGDTFTHIANEAIQMHGGIGMTDEFHIGLYLKRARAADATFGDAATHRRRWATLSGY